MTPATAERPSEVEMMWGEDDVWNYTAGFDEVQWPDPVVFDSTDIVAMDVQSTSSRAARSTSGCSTPSTLLSEPATSSCDCIDLLLLQNEKLSVTLFTSRDERKSSPANIFTDEIWRCQKGTMASCETLLGCDSCSSRSERVILLTSNAQPDDDIQSERRLGRITSIREGRHWPDCEFMNESIRKRHRLVSTNTAGENIHKHVKNNKNRGNEVH
ncbi:hypothetical protein LX32DRAFT_655824 [Colletotrichum zoysiae]|uniref:Uncharacterized protein n=1 Tax=Colletotrichum zoysiae TaxID=1216348 RepID=A0AAD9LWL2_9PEZI|nr:hypothetical protein LX32DRAFT_655824 [Colletotrichum zoysiae]